MSRGTGARPPAPNRVAPVPLSLPGLALVSALLGLVILLGVLDLAAYSLTGLPVLVAW